MPWEIRPVTSDELPAFIQVDGAAYSSPQTDEDIEAAHGPFEFDRSLAVVERQGAPELQEDVLRDILGESILPEDSQRCTVHQILVFQYERVESFQVARLRGRHHVRIPAHARRFDLSQVVPARDAGRAYLLEVLLPRWLENDAFGRDYWDWPHPVQSETLSEMVPRYMMAAPDFFPNWRVDSRNISAALPKVATQRNPPMWLRHHSRA